MKALPYSIRPWIAGAVRRAWAPTASAAARAARTLRDYFEVDAQHIAWATLVALARRGAVSAKTLAQAAAKLEIDPDKPDPLNLSQLIRGRARDPRQAANSGPPSLEDGVA